MRSINEVAGTVARAARGAGFPAGQAEDLGQVAAYLAGIRADLAIVTAALQEPIGTPQVDWRQDGVTIHKGPVILTGPTACDALVAGAAPITIADIAHAPLISAMLCLRALTPWWEGRVLTLGDCEILPAKPGPVNVPDQDWQVWSNLAARTYVPESAASRAAGAGAGLIDND
ncbi:MAG: DUF3726 domain-containing protein [Pseudomonadota bacterium]